MKKLLQILALVLALLPVTLSQASYGPVQEFPVPGHLLEFLVKQYNRPVDELRRIVAFAYAEGKKTFPTPLDILAVIGVESEFKHDARHPGGPSLGLMQINQAYNKSLDLFNPRENVRRGRELLEEYRSKASSDSKALLWYNRGPGGAISCEEGCEVYSTKVLALKRKLIYHSTKENTCSRYSSS